MDIVFAYALCALTLISALSSAQKVEVDFRWTLISNGSGGPSPRSNPALVWAPAARRLLLWGGVTGAGRQSGESQMGATCSFAATSKLNCQVVSACARARVCVCERERVCVCARALACSFVCVLSVCVYVRARVCVYM